MCSRLFLKIKWYLTYLIDFHSVCEGFWRSVASSSAPFRRSGWSHSAENVITRSAPFQLVKGERQSFYINGNLHKGFPWLSYGNVLQAGRGSNTIPPLVGKCAGWFRSSFHKEGQTCSTTWLHCCSFTIHIRTGHCRKGCDSVLHSFSKNFFSRIELCPRIREFIC